MHMSNLSTNNFGINHFGQKYRNKKSFEFLGDYSGVCLKIFQRTEQKLENAFLANSSNLLRIS